MITSEKLGRFGNLGNSLFQYCTLIGVGQKTGFEVKIPHNPTYYEERYNNYNYCILDGFNIDTPFITNEKYTSTFNHTGFKFNKDIFSISDNTNLHGYFQSEKYFNFYREHILDKLNFKDNIAELGDLLFNKLDIIPEETTSIHVRRGDFLKHSNHHPQQSAQYFKKAVNLIMSKNYLFFSDDIPWCKQVYSSNKNIYFSENQNPFVDLYAMSKCMNNITVNSSFSWWGAWLNTNINKQVIAPSNWFGPAYDNQPPTDIVPESWILI